MTGVTLLGPQRHNPCVGSVLAELGIGGAVAFVSAGWQEREPEEEELGEHLARPVLNLALYLRAEQVFARDGELFDAIRAHQEQVRDLQQIYRLRLDHALEAARELLRREGPPSLIEAERESAIESVRALDEHHVGRLTSLREEFAERWRPHERDEIAMHREALAGILARADALLIAGGHVAVLLNRLRLFGIDSLAGDLPIVAWSAGAMALSERVILFHDSPPQGAGNAEVFDVGLGMAPGIVPLPHAARRLRLDDPVRVGLFARRFAPAECMPLEECRWVRRTADGWAAGEGVTRLTRDGRVAEVAAS